LDAQERLKSSLADRYAIEREIGAGGMATVYLATDLRHHRQVAVKVLRPDLAATVGPERFLREIEVTAALRHPHILPLLDSGLAGDLPFYVMPFVDGESLRARLARERQLPIAEAVRIAREVCDALSHAHEHGVVHRDIKPENILLEAGHAVVADFGVAGAVREVGGERLTQTGLVVGTPGYLAPEQALGEGGMDARSDLYALGCVLYEMLAGQPPITGPTAAAVLARKVTETPPGVRELRPTVPPELEGVISRALSLVPADRQSTAAELTRELEAVTHGGASAVPAKPRRRVLRWIGAGAVAVAALLVAVALTWRLRGPGGTPVEEGAADRVVVLPYENRTGDPALDPVGQMAADWITEGLAQTGEVSVVPSSMVLEALAGLRGPSGAGGGEGVIGRVADLTQAGLAVTGSYYLRGGELELHSEIVEVASGTPLTAVDPARGPASDPGAAIDAVRVQVMGALSTRLSPTVGWEPFTARPPTYEAFRAYSRGMEEWIRGDFRSSGEWFLRAYATDTTYLRSLILASVCVGNTQGPQAQDSILEVLRSRREELTPYDRVRVDFLTAQLRGDRPAALAATRRAVEIAPVGTMTWALVWSLMANNRPGEARGVVERVAPAFRRLEAPWYDAWATPAEILHLLGDHERELQVTREGLERLPSNPFLMECEGRALAALGRADEVRSLAAAIASKPPLPGVNPGAILETLAGELRAHGDRAASLAVVDEALAWHAGQPAEFRDAAMGKELLGRLLYQGERWIEAQPMFESFLADSISPVNALGTLGAIAARRGDSPAAARYSGELARLNLPYVRGAHTAWRARIAALLGDRDEAVQLLRRAFAEGLTFGLWLHTDLDLETLRGYAPFEELIRPKG